MNPDQVVTTLTVWLKRVVIIVLLAMIAVTLVNALDVVKISFLKPFPAETLAYLAGALWLASKA